MDYNSQGPFFMIREKNVLTSSWGGVFTLILLLGCILIFYYFGDDCWKRKNPLLSFSQFDIKNFPSNENLFNVPIMIALSKSLADYTKLVYFTGTNLSYQDLQVEDCNDKHFNFFNVSSPNSNLKYYCSNYNKIFQNVTDFSQKLDSYIYIANCTELAQYNISDAECRGKSPPLYESQIKFRLWMATKEFDNNYENFIVDKIDYLSKDLIYSDKVFNQFFSEQILKLKKFSDDRNLIFKSNADIFFSSSLSIRQRNAEHSSIPYALTGKRIYVHSILIDPTYSSILRVYQKLDQMFARVMSMISILYFVIVFINNYISDYNLFSNLKMEFLISLDETDYNCLAKLIEVEKVDIEFFNSQINFKNFILNTLRIKNKNTIIFKELYKRFRIRLSCNNFYKIQKVIKKSVLQTNTEGVKLIRKEEDKEEEKYSLLEKADIFGETNYFCFGQEKIIKTVEGGIICFFKLLVIIFCIFFFGYDFWTSRIEDLQINQKSNYELSDEEKTFQIDAPFAIGYSQSAKEKLRLNLKNYSYVGYPEGAIKECSNEEYENNFKTKKNDTLYYLCGNLNYTLGNPLYDYSWLDKSLILQSCSDMKVTDKTTTNCNSNPKVDEVFQVELKLNLKELDFSDYKLKDKIWTFYSDGTYKEMLKLNLNFRNYKITNYINNIVRSPDSFQISTIQYFTSVKGQSPEFRFFHPTGQISILLVYVNFPEMLAKVFSMVQILTFLIKFIHSFVFEFKFKQKIIQNLLNFKDYEHTKLFLKNRIKFKNPLIDKIFISNSTPDNYSEMKKEIIKYISDVVYTFPNYLMMKIFAVKNQEFLYLDQKINSLLSIERLFDINKENNDKNRSPDILKINPEQIQILKNIIPVD